MRKLAFKPTRLSIVTPVLESYAIVRRQILHYKKMYLPDDIEIIYMDDGSDPPISDKVVNRCPNFYIYPTGDKRPWSIACARNLGIKIAGGEYIFNADVDHVLPREAIIKAYEFRGAKLEFNREYAVLDNKARIKQDWPTLKKYGLTRRYWKKHGVRRYSHVGTHCIKKSVVEAVDGYPIRCCDYGEHPTREDRLFYHRVLRYLDANRLPPTKRVDKVYVYPATDTDPRGLFHSLRKKGRFGKGGIQATQASGTKGND